MKRILVTGNEGYIGSVLVPRLMSGGYEVVGFDMGIFREVAFVPRGTGPTIQLYKDIRDITLGDLEGIDAVIHLAALSDDPSGALNPGITREINHAASVRLAELAKRAGVSRFLFSSSCSLYGVASEELVNEEAPLRPRTPYAESKVWAERDIKNLADEHFSPVFLRNATVFGVSPRMRLDLVVQNLAAYGYLFGLITILSDGTPWRPLIHVADVAEAFLFLLEAPQEAVHNQCFNVGHKENNLQIKTIAEMVRGVIPQTRIVIKNENPRDHRSYKVDFSKLYALGFSPRYTVLHGVREMYRVFQEMNFSEEDFQSHQYTTLKRYQFLLTSGALDNTLRVNPNLL